MTIIITLTITIILTLTMIKGRVIAEIIPIHKEIRLMIQIIHKAEILSKIRVKFQESNGKN